VPNRRAISSTRSARGAKIFSRRASSDAGKITSVQYL
jgi:hypothetical protein